MSRSAISKWLHRAPQPTHVLLDGETLLAIGGGVQRMAVAERAIRDKGASLLEALTVDKAGLRTSLRTYRVPELDDDQGDEPSAPAVASSTSEIVQVAKLLSDAYKQGAADHAAAYVGIEAAYKAGFSELVNLVKIMSGRLEGLEKAWQSTLNAQARAAQQAAREAELAYEADQETDAAAALSTLAGAVMSNVVQGPRPGKKAG